MVKVCECCGHPLPSPAEQLGLTRMQGRIFDIVQRAGRAGVAPRVLAQRVYADDPNGGPEHAEVSLYVQRHKMQDKLASAGLKIITTRGHGAIWRLEAL